MQEFGVKGLMKVNPGVEAAWQQMMASLEREEFHSISLIAP